MSPEFDKLLCEKYPKIFADRNKSPRESPMHWGFECGDGWFPLIDALCGFLQFHTDRNGYPQIRATQVKEKFGTLSFYTTSEEVQSQFPRSAEFLYGAIEFAENLSAHTCEVCGKAGKVVGDGWFKCRCPDHEEI